MSVTIQVICSPELNPASDLRTLFCLAAAGKLKLEPDDNPLIKTDFNTLLQTVAQAAFNEGVQYARNVKIPDRYDVRTS